MLNVSAAHKNLPKDKIDLIQEDCKQTIQNLLYHLTASLQQNDSEQWFRLHGIAQPDETDLELYLNMENKMQEVMVEVAYNTNQQTKTEQQDTLVKDMAQMLFGIKNIKTMLAQLVTSSLTLYE
jgi:hypothetical protein